MRKELLSVREICAAAVFAALTAVCAQIAIPLPSSVPISFGMVGVYAAAILLPPKCAVLSQICYLLLGAAGVPVFGGLRGGLNWLFGPTGGYLLMYPVMAIVVSAALNGKRALQAEEPRRRILVKGAGALCAAHLLLYIGGTLWLSALSGVTFIAALSVGVFPFVLFDAVKIAFCAAAIIPLRKRFMRINPAFHR